MVRTRTAGGSLYIEGNLASFLAATSFNVAHQSPGPFPAPALGHFHPAALF